MWPDQLGKSKINLDNREKKQSLTKKNQNDIFLKNIEAITYWIDSSKPKLTCKIYSQDHEIMITSWKSNQKNILRLNSQSTQYWRMKLKTRIKKSRAITG
jgi:hypothetical protein